LDEAGYPYYLQPIHQKKLIYSLTNVLRRHTMQLNQKKLML